MCDIMHGITKLLYVLNTYSKSHRNKIDLPLGQRELSWKWIEFTTRMNDQIKARYQPELKPQPCPLYATREYCMA